MRIPFNYKNNKTIYILTNDKNGYQIGKQTFSKDSVTGETKESLADNTYYHDIPSAIQNIFERGIKLSDAKTFVGLAKDIEETKNMIEKLVNEFFKIKIEMEK